MSWRGEGRERIACAWMAWCSGEVEERVRDVKPSCALGGSRLCSGVGGGVVEVLGHGVLLEAVDEVG